MATPARHFLVCVHDVCPAWEPQLRTILQPLAGRVGQAFAAAVIPRPGGLPWSPRDAAFAGWVRRQAGELQLHGLTHRRPGSASPYSWLIRRADEFAALPPAEAERRLAEGQALLAALFGAPPCGFVPPAWRWGSLTPQMLERHGLRYGMRLTALVRPGLPARPLATWSWDCGRIGRAGWLGAWAGHLMALRPAATPCIVLHPADVERGFLAHALRRIESLMRRGLRPVLPAEFAFPSRRPEP